MKNNRYFERGITAHAIEREIEFEAPPNVTVKKLKKLCERNKAKKEEAKDENIAVFHKGFVYILNNTMTSIITVYPEERYNNRRNKKYQESAESIRYFPFKEFFSRLQKK